MINFAPITEYSFKFSPHLDCVSFHDALNNSFLEQFEDIVVERFSTNANRTTITGDIIVTIWDAIITTLKATS